MWWLAKYFCTHCCSIYIYIYIYIYLLAECWREALVSMLAYLTRWPNKMTGVWFRSRSRSLVDCSWHVNRALILFCLPLLFFDSCWLAWSKCKYLTLYPEFIHDILWFGYVCVYQLPIQELVPINKEDFWFPKSGVDSQQAKTMGWLSA